ncbi:hypothetical protein BASA50_006117 [Batrachochytrium salamandrivorans]|uniref:Uncharacterized protein n=1 Tax=Batrachochytrium salamandrivorans TaxID=1357716 RepID=A0ABQ8FAX5_9FUNG|nr:hypothetical protein BASA50_006117 [Batrachochytrium salamandrivorans]
MRVNVLVIAAMVVTSVNAGGKERPRGLFKQGDGSGLKSKAPFGLRVYPLFPKKRPVHDSGASQDTDPTSKESSNGSDDDAAKKNQPASLSISNNLKDNKETLKTEEIGNRFASYNLVNAKLETIKKRFVVSDEYYRETYGELVQNDCSTEFPRLIPPKEMMELSVTLNEHMELPEPIFMLHSPRPTNAGPDLLRHLRLHRGAKYIHSPHPDRVLRPSSLSRDF